MMQKRFLTEKQTAKLLGISPKKLQKDRLHKTGLAYLKFGKRVLYDSKAIEEFVQTHTVST